MGSLVSGARVVRLCGLFCLDLPAFPIRSSSPLFYFCEMEPCLNRKPWLVASDGYRSMVLLVRLYFFFTGMWICPKPLARAGNRSVLFNETQTNTSRIS